MPPPDYLALANTRRSRFVRWLFKSVVWLYLRLVHRFAVVGVEYVPTSGPFVGVSNHTSLLDPIILLAAFPQTKGFIPAKQSLFTIPLLADLLRAGGAVPVRRDRSDIDTARLLLRSLRVGVPVGITAEGTRSRNGQLQPFLPQVGKIALVANVPVVPLAIVGSFEALPPGAWLPRPKPITVLFGQAIDPRTAVAGVPEADRPARLADLLHAAVAALIAQGTAASQQHLRAVPKFPPS